VLYRGLSAGEQVDVRGAAMVLRVGDPAAVHLTINGAPARCPGGPARR
jgi:hypothetical protein